jgi:hypothetical protein
VKLLTKNNYPDAKLSPSSLMLRFNERVIGWLLFSYSLLLLVTGLLSESPGNLISGLQRIFYAPSALLTDYMELASPGTAFFNAGLMTLFYLLVLKLSGIRLRGTVLAAFFMLSGFSLFGKNLFSALPISLGVLLFALVFRRDFRDLVLQSLFGACLGPLVSQVAFHFDLPLRAGLIYACLLGLATGFILPSLTAVTGDFHQGYSLYNMGLAAGLYSTVVVSILSFAGADFIRPQIVYEMKSPFLIIWLTAVLLALLILGILTGFFAPTIAQEQTPQGQNEDPDGLVPAYGRLLKASGRLITDYADDFGIGLTLINMSLSGLAAMAYALLIAGYLNGPIMGAILSVVGFAAYGKHPRNILPIMIGVHLTILLSGADILPTNAVIYGLLGTNLAPLAGHFGFIPGVLAGMIHMTFVGRVSALHCGVNLYNNGLSGGLVAIVFMPMLNLLEQKKVLPRQLWQRIRRN